jgi:Zn-dependent protease with chaperone function
MTLLALAIAALATAIGFGARAQEQPSNVSVVASGDLRAYYTELPRQWFSGFSVSSFSIDRDVAITQLGFELSFFWFYGALWGGVLNSSWVEIWPGSYNPEPRKEGWAAAGLTLGTYLSFTVSENVRLWLTVAAEGGFVGVPNYTFSRSETKAEPMATAGACAGIDWPFLPINLRQSLQLQVGACLKHITYPAGLDRRTWNQGKLTVINDSTTTIGLYIGVAFGTVPGKRLLDPWAETEKAEDRWVNAVTGKIETVTMSPAVQAAISNQAPGKMKAAYLAEVASNDRIERIGQRLLQALKELEAEANALLEESRKREALLISRQAGRAVALAPRNVRWQRNIRFYELQTLTPNAFSLGDSIFVTTGLLNLLDDDQLAAVLGHEIAHSVFRDTPQALEAEAQRNLILLIVALVTGSRQTVERWDTIFELTFRSRSRDEEREADTFGLLLGCRAGFDRARMVTLFDVVAGIEALEGASGIPTYLRTHPEPQKRKVAADKACQLPKWWGWEPVK